MFCFLIKHWKARFKLIENESIFKAFLAMVLFIFVLCISVIEILCVKDRNIIGFFIIISLCIQYNRNSIIVNITDNRTNPFKISDKNVFLRFCLFQILKENIIIFPAVIVSLILSILMFFVDWVIAFLMFIIVVFEISSYIVAYKSEKNKKNNKKIMYTRMKMNKIGIAYSNIAYFLRQPLGAYFEMLIEIAVVIVMVSYGVSISVINYLFIILLVLEIEIEQDKSMNRYNVSYGKYTIKELSGLSFLYKYLGSNEFRIFLKYCIIEVSVVVYSNIGMAGFIVLMFAVSYKYLCASLYVYKERCLIKNTIFRTVMFYSVLVSIAPFLFEKEMYMIFANYKVVYGMIFMFISSVIILLVPVEKMTNIFGESVDGK